MGGCTFINHCSRFYESAQEAFNAAVESDRYENGHSYSGGIGMKSSFVKVGSVETLKEASDMAWRMIDEDDSRISDKWGPAGYIEVTNDPDDAYLFFGWASS